MGNNIKQDKAKRLNAFAPSDTVKIGKAVYLVERHFTGDRNVREAVYTAVKNEVFRALEGK